MSQYLLSVWHDDEYVVEFESEAMQRIVAQVGAFNQELASAGAEVYGGGLQPASSATVVRASGGEVSMTDGPYAESKEQMGGFWIIEAPDFDAALEWAGKATAACEAPVEVRPFQSGG
ncbi:MAG TPA: YciI family protein [Acidimicrobiales bacterium]|nr:YciI family protein [Acidimicrobiales bacterium]